MSHAHVFFRVDLQRLRALFGSQDDALARQILKKRADDIENIDLIFEDPIRDGSCPDAATALREILAGAPSQPRQPSLYGCVLEILCEHIGRSCDDEVAVVRDHPYESQLVRSGPPIPIPYDPECFPQIGFLDLADIPAEIQRLEAAPRTKVPAAAPAILRPEDFPTKKDYDVARRRALQQKLEKTSWILGNDDALQRDMDCYHAILRDAVKKRSDLISFRH